MLMVQTLTEHVLDYYEYSPIESEKQLLYKLEYRLLKIVSTQNMNLFSDTTKK